MSVLSERINPFEPNSPVTREMFVGRTRELAVLRGQMGQTKAGRPAHFSLIGERGIGKSSLLNYTKSLARGHVEPGEQAFNFLVIDTDLQPGTSQFGLMKKIEYGLKRELEGAERARAILSSAWEFLQRVEGAGFRINADPHSTADDVLLERFADALAETANRLCADSGMNLVSGPRFDGIMILIDEADKGRQVHLGLFLKLLTERLQRRECRHVMIGLAGLPDLRQVLLESHPSSLRVFEELSLERLWDQDVIRVIQLCFGRAEKENKRPTRITLGAQQALLALSEGLPHFIQQFGYSSFAVDDDFVVDEDDVTTGAFGSNGALKTIGDRYYRDSFYNRIQKDSYREVLRIMADHLDDWVPKGVIRVRFSGTPSTLDNALQALRDRGVILSKEGERGVYRLQQKGFALWILYTSDPDTLRRRFFLPPGASTPATAGDDVPSRDEIIPVLSRNRKRGNSR
jgi:hypothetical protein